MNRDTHVRARRRLRQYWNTLNINDVKPQIFRAWSIRLLAFAFIATSGYTEDVPNPLQSGRELARARKFSEAAAQFDLAVASDPKSAEARFERGNALAEQGRTTGPLEDFDAAIRLKPDYFEAWYMRGHIHARRNDHEAAIEDFTEAIRLRPKSALAHHYRGISHYELQQQFQGLSRSDEADHEKDLAAPDFEEAIRLDPKLAEAYYYHARTAGWWLDNLEDYNTAIRLNPNRPQWYYWRGNVQMFNDHPTEAIADFTAAIRLDPNDQHFYNDRAAVYDDQGKHELAVADLTEAIRVKPELPFFRHNRGENYLFLSKWEQAREDFNVALQLKSDYWVCYTLRALPEAHLGDRTAALADLATGEQHREDEGTYTKFARGQAYAEAGVYGKAVAAFNDYLEERRGNVPALINRGNAYGHLRQFENALADEEKALRAEPNNRYAHQALGTIYLSMGKAEEALAEYDHAIALDEKVADAYYDRALAQFRLRRTPGFDADAAQYVARTSWKDDRSVYLALLRAIATRRDGKEDVGRKALDEAAEKADSTRWPYPILQAMRGGGVDDGLIKLAGEDLAKQTEARAYPGLYLAATGNKAAALPLLEWVRDRGDKNSVEYTEAVLELERLND